MPLFLRPTEESCSKSSPMYVIKPDFIFVRFSNVLANSLFDFTLHNRFWFTILLEISLTGMDGQLSTFHGYVQGSGMTEWSTFKPVSDIWTSFIIVTSQKWLSRIFSTLAATSVPSAQSRSKKSWDPEWLDYNQNLYELMLWDPRFFTVTCFETVAQCATYFRMPNKRFEYKPRG